MNKRFSGLSCMGVFIIPLLLAKPAWAVKISTTGNKANVNPPASQAICLAGGGSDDGWAEGWKYMLSRTGGGDVVIINVSGTRGYENWIYNDTGTHGFPKVNSVTTITIMKASDANRTDVETLIRNAEMVFFDGGDQTLYIDYFRGSKLMAAVEYVMNIKRVPIGGTSAGMALLAGIDYAAHYGSPTKKNSMVTSSDVINDPTGVFVDLDRGVLVPPFMSQVITDTHFSERGRQGRLVGFMARAVYNNYGDIAYDSIKGIGADGQTAVCYDATGMAQVFGQGSVYFLKGNSPIERISSGLSLNWYAGGEAVKAYVISGSNPNAAFDLVNWTGTGGAPQFWFVNGLNEASPFFGFY